MLRWRRVTSGIGGYTKKIQIEGRVLGDISTNHVIPTAIRYQNTLIENKS
jgi:glutamine synthetase type III